MRRHSGIVSFFKGCFYVGIFFLVGMLYWSSLLVEDQLHQVRDAIESLKGDLWEVQDKPAQKDVNVSSAKDRSWIDETLPNLLKNDPFYQTTLPKLLGSKFSPFGVLRTATFGKPDNLHPFSPWSEVATWGAMCTPSLAGMKVGIYETMAPDLAIKIEERKEEGGQFVDYWVHLRDGIFWNPLKPKLFPNQIHLNSHFLKKHPVTANDFKLYFDAIMNPHVESQGAIALRTLLQGMISIKVIDPLTFVVRWEAKKVVSEDGKVSFQPKYVAKLRTGALRPLPCFVFQYYPDGTKIVEEDQAEETYRTHATWGQIFSTHWAKNVIVSCGPWIFDGMTDRMVSFKRSPHYWNPYAVLVDRMEVLIRSTQEAIWQDFKAGSLDLYTLQPAQKIDMEQFLNSPDYGMQKQEGMGVNTLEYLNRAYYYIGWNETKPYFKSKKVRQALAMAVDRQRMIRQNLFGMGMEIHGTFYRYSKAYDTSIAPWPYDPYQAKQLLESEGWYDRDGDGIIDNVIDGKIVPFRFTLIYFVKNATTKSICDFVTTAFKEIGIDCQLKGVDIADLSKAFDDKSFDALALGWGLETPPENPKQLWDSSLAKQKGSSNAIGFSNTKVDAIIEELEYEANPEKRVALYHQFDAILHEEAPYLFLYSPKSLLLFRSNIKNIFIPAERQDLIPGADVMEPELGTATILRK